MSVKSDNGALARAGNRVKGAVRSTYRRGRAARGLDHSETREVRSGQMTNQFTTMVQVAVTLAIGVLITGQIFDALPSTSGPLSNASDQVESLTATAFELAPVVLVVIVAALVIGVVRRI